MKERKIDWLLTLVPFGLIVGLTVWLFIQPAAANDQISKIRFFFGDTLGAFYIVMGVAVMIGSLFLAFSGYGSVVLGETGEKQKY